MTLRAVPFHDAFVAGVHSERIAPEAEFDSVSACDFREPGEFVRELDFVDFAHERGKPAVINKNDVDAGFCGGVQFLRDCGFGNAKSQIRPGIGEHLRCGVCRVIRVTFEPVALEPEVTGKSDYDAV